LQRLYLKTFINQSCLKKNNFKSDLFKNFFILLSSHGCIQIRCALVAAGQSGSAANRTRVARFVSITPAFLGGGFAFSERDRSEWCECDIGESSSARLACHREREREKRAGGHVKAGAAPTRPPSHPLAPSGEQQIIGIRRGLDAGCILRGSD